MSKEYALILCVSSGIGAACATELAKAGINMPVTGFASHTKDIEGVIETVGSIPLIM